MVKPGSHNRLLLVIVCTLLFAFLSVPGAFCQDRAASEAGSYNQRGMEYFKKGFYDHAPKSQVTEAERYYGLAIKEFKDAISRDPFYTEAHRNLARVYFVQKNYDGAAEQYKRVTELAANDLDAYVNLSLALIELQRLDEAIQVLEKAKQQTFDPKALKTLDTYISKIRVYQAKGVK